MKNHYKILLIFIVLTLSRLLSYSQKVNNNYFSNINHEFNKIGCRSKLQNDSTIPISIKFNPLQWYHDDIRFFFEYPIAKNMSLELRLGYRNSILNPYLYEYENYEYTYTDQTTGESKTIRESTKGFNIGIGYNYYMKHNWYIQPCVLFKDYWYIFGDPEDWTYVDKFFFGGTANWDNWKNSFRKNILSGEIRIGKIFSINNFLINPFFGLGFRYKWMLVSNDNYFGSAYSSYSFVPGTKKHGSTPTLHLGFNIGWAFKKK